LKKSNNHENISNFET